MTRPSLARAAPGFAAAIAAALALATSTGPAGAQENGPALDLVEQTVVVSEDPVVVVLDIIDPPTDALLGITIWADPRLTREDVRDSHGDAPGTGDRIAAFECTLDGDCFDQALLEPGDDDRFTLTLDDEVIGESLRRDAGALPVEIRLLSDEGETLDSFLTSIVVLGDVSPRGVRVGFVGSLAAPVAHGPDGSIDINGGPIRGSALTMPADLDVTFDLRPESLSALEGSEPGELEDVLEAIGGRPLLRSPWVAMDEEAWRLADREQGVIDGYTLGRDTFERITGIGPTGIVRLDPDATVDTLTLLRTVGATAVIVDDAHLDAGTVRREAMRPIQILDTNGIAMPALRFDEALHLTLDGPDPELAAARAITELTIAAHEAELDDGEGSSDLEVLLDLDRIDPIVLDLFLTLIDERREVRVTTVEQLAAVDPGTDGDGPLRATLVADAAPDVRGVVTDLAAARAALDTLAAMLEPEIEPIDALGTQLLAAVSSDLTPAEASAYAGFVVAAVVDRTTGIEVPVSDRITLTDRRTDLPLTVVNNQPSAINVDVILSAEKLRFPDGDRLSLRLEPGENPLVIPVETLASGDARVTATVVSPGGAFELATGTVDIRSTAISGVGLAISIVAMLVLGAWWIRTILRVRRNRHTATVAAASDDEFDAEEGEP
ncbi:MAG: DUF6049 family protein [Actinomycetota bacterium]